MLRPKVEVTQWRQFSVVKSIVVTVRSESITNYVSYKLNVNQHTIRQITIHAHRPTHCPECLERFVQCYDKKLGISDAKIQFCPPEIPSPTMSYCLTEECFRIYLLNVYSYFLVQKPEQICHPIPHDHFSTNRW